MPPTDDGWGKIGVLMVLLALAFAGGVAYFIATSESAEAETAAAAGTAVVDENGAAPHDEDAAGELQVAGGVGEDNDPEGAENPVATTTDTDVAADLIALGTDAGAGAAIEVAPSFDAGSDPLRANGEVDRPTGLVSMSIESEPPGAQVIRKSDGVRLGLTPYRYEVESSRGSITFVLKLEGHKSMSVPMPADRDSVRQVILFPGKGGEIVPAQPVTAEVEKVEGENKDTAGEPADEKPPAKPVDKSSAKNKAPPKRIKPKKPRLKTSRPKKPKKPRKPKKPSGTVDFRAGEIPLD